MLAVAARELQGTRSAWGRFLSPAVTECHRAGSLRRERFAWHTVLMAEIEDQVTAPGEVLLASRDSLQSLKVTQSVTGPYPQYPSSGLWFFF